MELLPTSAFADAPPLPAESKFDVSHDTLYYGTDRRKATRASVVRFCRRSTDGDLAIARIHTGRLLPAAFIEQKVTAWGSRGVDSNGCRHSAWSSLIGFENITSQACLSQGFGWAHLDDLAKSHGTIVGDLYHKIQEASTSWICSGDL